MLLHNDSTHNEKSVTKLTEAEDDNIAAMS